MVILLVIILVGSATAYAVERLLIYQQKYYGKIYPPATITGLKQNISLGNITVSSGGVVITVSYFYKPFNVTVYQNCTLVIEIENATELKKYLHVFKMEFNVTELNKVYRITLDNPVVKIPLVKPKDKPFVVYHIIWGYTKPIAKPVKKAVDIVITVNYYIEV